MLVLEVLNFFLDAVVECGDLVGFSFVEVSVTAVGRVFWRSRIKRGRAFVLRLAKTQALYQAFCKKHKSLDHSASIPNALALRAL